MNRNILKYVIIILLSSNFGCSNAPPIGYSNIQGEQLFGRTFSLKPNFLQKNKTFRDTVEYDIGCCSDKYPLWVSSDVFYLGINFSPSIFDVGLYAVNFYPGAYLGLKYKYAAINYFVTTTLELKKRLPGWQGSVNVKGVVLSYSKYMENVGSTIHNPAFGQEGPYRVGESERIFLGYELKKYEVTIVLGAFYNSTFMKGVRAMGIECSISI